MEDTSDLEKTLEYRPAPSVRPVTASVVLAARRRRTIQSGTIALALLAAVAVVGAVVVRVGVSPAPAARPATFAREPSQAGRAVSATPSDVSAAPGSPAAASDPITSDVPTVDVASLPRPPVGTVVGAPKHRLWIDGHLAPTWKRAVKCGSHTVQVGSQGEERVVNVPCGGEVNVAP